MFSITVTVNTSYEMWNDSAMLRFDDHIFFFFFGFISFQDGICQPQHYTDSYDPF